MELSASIDRGCVIMSLYLPGGSTLQYGALIKFAAFSTACLISLPSKPVKLFVINLSRYSGM